MYFNKFNFINGVYGIKVVFEIYFDKEQDEFNVNEVAMFVGMLKNFFLFDLFDCFDMVLYWCMVVFK